MATGHFLCSTNLVYVKVNASYSQFIAHTRYTPNSALLKIGLTLNCCQAFITTNTLSRAPIFVEGFDDVR